MVPKLTALKTGRKFLIRKGGFTLIELIIVIAILGLIVTAGLSSYTNSQKTARDARRKTDLETLRQGLELYRSTNGVYAAAAAGSTETGANALKNYLTSPVPYISAANFPKDPKTSQNYFYYFERDAANSSAYRTCAYLEAKLASDPSCPTAGYVGTPNCKTVGGNVACNYGMTQP